MYCAVQSNKEKQLQKQLRKEAKKIERLHAKLDKELQATGEDHETHLKALGYDPESLRQERHVTCTIVHYNTQCLHELMYTCTMYV